MYEYRARVIRVVDGDTVDVDIDLGFHVWSRQRLRLVGIDTPERGQSGFAAATVAVQEWCDHVQATLIIRTRKSGKFGRWLAVLIDTISGQCLNQLLLDKGLAKPYSQVSLQEMQALAEYYE